MSIFLVTVLFALCSTPYPMERLPDSVHYTYVPEYRGTPCGLSHQEENSGESHLRLHSSLQVSCHPHAAGTPSRGGRFLHPILDGEIFIVCFVFCQFNAL